MAFIKAGCCGFPVARQRYFQQFSTVEIDSSFYNLPQLSTAQRWREDAPKDFEFSLKAWQLITHTSSSPTYRRLTSKMGPKSLARCGNFRQTPEVASAWERTAAVARVLGAKFILFQCPAGFYPNADHLRNIYRFFKGIRRERGVSLVWEPRGSSWGDKLTRTVCGDLGLVLGLDPMISGVEAESPIYYFRLHGKYEGGRLIYSHRYGDAELRSLLGRCGRRPSYVYFNNTAMWDDARRFVSLASHRAP